jgi:MFS transporter, putative metabolite:H+ symporter
VGYEMTVLQRLERLPMARPQWRLLFQGGLGYTFDGMDAALVAFILPSATAVFSLSSSQTGLLGSSVLIGYLFGALSAGVLGDLIGRKRVMMYALAIYAVASLVAALSPSWGFLFWSRVVAGFGTGAESAIIAPFLAEFVAGRYRGRFIGSLAGFFSFGFVLAALLGYFIVPNFDAGWRWVQIISALPIVMILWWRRSLPESPRWLLEHGRPEETERVVDGFEEEITRGGTSLPPVEKAEVPPARSAPAGSVIFNLATLWRSALAGVTASTWAIWFAITFSYYGFFTWIPSLLVDQGYSIADSFAFSIAIYLAQIPGYYSAAFIGEYLDRKWTIGVYLAGGAVAALLMSTAGNPTTIIAFGVLLSFFMNGTYAAVYAYTPEVYPTAVRSTGMGAASAFSRVGGILAPIAIGVTYGSIGFGGVFMMTTAVLAAGVVAVIVFGLATASRTLEDISAEELGTRG